MKIKEIEKDLFLEKYRTGDIYAHCISADFVLGKGIARTFKEKFPELKKNNLKRILMPKIGCGLDRLDWDLVKQIIEKIFEETDIEIKVFYI